MKNEDKDVLKVGIVLLLIAVAIIIFALNYDSSIKENNWADALLAFLMVACGIGGVYFIFSSLSSAFKDKVGEVVQKTNSRKELITAASKNKYGTYEELVFVAINEYIAKNGQQKFNKVIETLHTSKKIKTYFYHKTMMKEKLKTDEILSMICEIPYFISQSNETIKMAGLIVLHKWKREVNDDLPILSEKDFLRLGIDIISELH